LLENRGREWEHQEGTPIQWKWIERGTVMLVEDSGTWLDTVGTGGREVR